MNGMLFHIWKTILEWCHSLFYFVLLIKKSQCWISFSCEMVEERVPGFFFSTGRNCWMQRQRMFVWANEQHGWGKCDSGRETRGLHSYLCDLFLWNLFLHIHSNLPKLFGCCVLDTNINMDPLSFGKWKIGVLRERFCKLGESRCWDFCWNRRNELLKLIPIKKSEFVLHQVTWARKSLVVWFRVCLCIPSGKSCTLECSCLFVKHWKIGIPKDLNYLLLS